MASRVKVEKRKRVKSLQTKKIESVLADLQEDFDGLSPFERQLVLQSIRELSDDGSSDTLKALWEADFIRYPVNILQLLEDPYYFGDLVRDLYPCWREELEFVLRPNSGIQEWIFGGSIGCGKTTCATIALAVQLYYLSCLRDPHEFYGLVKGSSIVLGIYSISKTQATDSSFSKLRTFVDSSPYFRDNYPRVQRIKSKLVFQRGAVQVIAGSTELHAIGLDLYAFLLDEANFLRDPRKPKSGEDGTGLAYKIYNAARTRVRSRFMQKGGMVPGMVFLISSKKTHRSFLETHMEEISDDIKSGAVHVSEYSLWQALAGSPKALEQGLFTMPVFRVEIGDQIHPSRILEEGIDPRPGADVIEVPGEYYTEFASDVDQALRDLAGVATYGISPLIHDGRCIIECVTDKIEHPFTKEVLTLDERNDVTLDQYFIPERMFVVRRSVYAPKFDPASPRFMHVDIGLTGDAAGIACSHVSSFKEVRRQRGDGTYYMDRCPIIMVDFVLKIIPPSGAEIDISKIRSFIISLTDNGLPIVAVTADGFQCFTAETQVALLDGTERTMKELADEYGCDKEFWVYSYDTEKQRIVPGLARNARKTGRKEVCTVHLDNGESVRCTIDHRWMLRDGTYRMACELRVGDSLMPLYRAFRLDEAGIGRQRGWQDRITRHNHRVACIEFTGEMEDVYDIEVYHYHNFALSAGVFVHNSRDLMQILRKLGYESRVYSIDRTDEPYLYLRQAFVERRLEMYSYEPVFVELRDLERDIERRKVDHPKISNITGLPGSKDVADALCGSVANCIIDPRTVTAITGQELLETGTPRGGGYYVPQVQSRSGAVDWNSIEDEARKRR